jgi:hypothetical protein
MGLSAKELTELSNEVMRARRNLDRILDFVDLINKDAEKLEGDVTPAGNQIKEISDKLGKSIEEISIQVETQLNKIPIDPEETKDAASKLGLYHGTVHQVISYADTEKSKYKENSYWWRYWVSILDNVMQQEIENPSKPIGKGKQFLEKRN